MTAAGDRASATVFVAVTPADAFEVFTTEIDLWWRSGPRFRPGTQRGVLCFETRLGGRLFEQFADGPTLEVGEVTAWEPPARLELTWRNVNFAPGEVTFVEVRFVPERDGTLVTVVHRGWAALRDDHPARHGRTGAAMSRQVGLWWGQLLTALREHVNCRSTSPAAP